MKLFGYAIGSASPELIIPDELAEITLIANPRELRTIASFLLAAAEGMEKRGADWEHEHLSDQYKEFQNSPHFIVFNPEATS